jgi:tetratricopeptide (TPR) repeat protein
MVFRIHRRSSSIAASFMLHLESMRRLYVLLRFRLIWMKANCVQVECYQRAVRLDQYLAVAYFQQGVSNFLVGDFEEALANFNDTLLYLRGNNMIDYAQLGLMFKLYSCEVLFNRGLCYIYLQQKEAGMQDFSFAVKEKVVEDHNVIDEAIREEAEVRFRNQLLESALLIRSRDTPFSQYP